MMATTFVTSAAPAGAGLFFISVPGVARLRRFAPAKLRRRSAALTPSAP
jgi:hypothetical protein